MGRGSSIIRLQLNVIKILLWILKSIQGTTLSFHILPPVDVVFNYTQQLPQTFRQDILMVHVRIKE